MAARLQDIAIRRNAGWAKVLTFYRDKARTQPVDLTSYTGKCQLRAAESQASALLADVALTFESRLGGSIKLALTLAQITALSTSEGWFDVLLAPPGGDPACFCYARVIIGDGVTAWP